ncbi:hypothetical protein QBC40DRAFT_286132 [Triangularia verruculosa]|uniref:Uncharacterized protein n=1 Tax=Triangularia verruculosa TaxID=2587418 RepID=A0AAN6XEF5_9PEZI|nr:hypothetical protein QBC40DRAFT_286132 [Triangularia verruculosa]
MASRVKGWLDRRRSMSSLKATPPEPSNNATSYGVDYNKSAPRNAGMNNGRYSATSVSSRYSGGVPGRLVPIEEDNNGGYQPYRPQAQSPPPPTASQYNLDHNRPAPTPVQYSAPPVPVQYSSSSSYTPPTQSFAQHLQPNHYQPQLPPPGTPPTPNSQHNSLHNLYTNSSSNTSSYGGGASTPDTRYSSDSLAHSSRQYTLPNHPPPPPPQQDTRYNGDSLAHSSRQYTLPRLKKPQPQPSNNNALPKPSDFSKQTKASTLEVQRCIKLLRALFKLRMKIWSAQESHWSTHPKTVENMAQADDLLRDIQDMVGNWQISIAKGQMSWDEEERLELHMIQQNLSMLRPYGMGGGQGFRQQ